MSVSDHNEIKTIPMIWSKEQTFDNKIRCSCCNREIKTNIRWVEVVDGGRSVIFPNSNPNINDPGYMGSFPVGPDCVKKHFRGFAV